MLLLIHSYLPALGGAETAVGRLAGELVARGHRALVVTHAPVRTFAWEPGAVPVLRLRIPPQCERFAAGRRYAAWRNAFNMVVLAAVALRFRADVVSCHAVNMDTVYGRWLARLLRIPNTVTLRGTDVVRWGRLNAHRERYVAAALAGADRVSAVARALLVEAERYLPGVAARGAVIPNLVDAAALGAVAQVSPPSAPYVLYAGRLSAEKRVETAIDAFHALARDGHLRDAELRIAGDGPLAADLCARAAAGPASARIRFLGAAAPAGTAGLIKSAAALVLCSEHEGCPNVVLEAMALGAPVVAADIPAVRELVAPGETGTLYPGGDAAALAACLGALLADPAPARAMAARAGAYVRERHAPGAITDAYLALFAPRP